MKGLLLIFIMLICIYPKIILAHEQDSIVIITSNGFEPSKITITQGSKITFINSDKEPHWPASDSHPTHDIYPQFDPTEAIAPGKSWKFIPSKEGQWGYHDHLNHNKKGVLIVEKDPNHEFGLDIIVNFIKTNLNNWLASVKNYFSLPSNNILSVQAFENLSSKDQLEELKKIADAKGLQEAWQYIKQNFANQSGLSGNIHDLAHLTGGLIYKEKGFNGLSLCTPEFAFGCFHGFLDSAFAKSLDDLSKAEAGCEKLGNSGPISSCIHGIGHGVASFYQSANLEEALNACNKLSSGSQFCHDGVFMEFERSADSNFYNLSDPLYPCNKLEKDGLQYSFSCGRNQSAVMLDRFKYDLDKVISTCLDSNLSMDFKSGCIDSVGFAAAHQSSNPDQIIEICQGIKNDDFVAKCAKAAAGELIFQNISGWQNTSTLVCLELLPQYQSDCLSYINNIKMQYQK